MVRTVLYTNKASKINCLPCTDLISLTARLDLLPHIMQQIPKDQSNRSTERVIFWSGRQERDRGCSEVAPTPIATSQLHLKSTGHPGISLMSVPAVRYVNGTVMKKEIEKSQILKTLVVIHLSAGWHHVQVCHYWILLPPLGDSSQISWLSMAEIEAFMFFISWWKITLNTFRLCFVFAPIDTQRITSDRSVVYWFWSNWVSLWVLLHTRPV